LSTHVPRAIVIAAAAEALPICDHAIDVVSAAHSFHWFDGTSAISEFHRVLRRGGVLAVVWNEYDHDDPRSVHVRLDEVMEPFLDQASPVSGALHSWREAFDRSGLFAALPLETITHRHVVDARDLAASCATTSDVATLPERRRRGLLDAVDSFARSLDGPAIMGMTVKINLFRPC
jgi:SAM-dependent methyltransferase